MRGHMTALARDLAFGPALVALRVVLMAHTAWLMGDLARRPSGTGAWHADSTIIARLFVALAGMAVVAVGMTAIVYGSRDASPTRDSSWWYTVVPGAVARAGGPRNARRDQGGATCRVVHP